tara:strand:+ start:821 stop:1789 length:969 start_codon:yes stop_codon:yes gene_type:complete
MSQIPSPEVIKEKILENFVEYQSVFNEFQSNFLSGLYKYYQGLENGNIVLYFEKLTHQDILRQKDYDLNFDISFNKFWENHSLVNLKKNSIINISKKTSLPKETTRRKILLLIKQKVLNKKNNRIELLPNESYKVSYNLFVDKEIEELSRLLLFICTKINLPISSENIKDELKNKFNFYWFHFLNVQLEYLKLWTLQIKDRELILIFLQFISMFVLRAKNKNISHKNLYTDPNLIKNFDDISISATSISEVTGIPRATCIRKLKALIKLKMISQNQISKQYYIIPTVVTKNIITKIMTEKVSKIFSEFYFICIRALSVKISN